MTSPVNTHAAMPFAMLDLSHVSTDAEFVGRVHVRQGVVVGAFVLDLPKVRVLLMQACNEMLTASGVTVQELAQKSVKLTSELLAESVCSTCALARRAAWSTGEACVTGAWTASTWPWRAAYRAVCPK